MSVCRTAKGQQSAELVMVFTTQGTDAGNLMVCERELERTDNLTATADVL